MNKTHLRWGCRRGMLELDLVLRPFLDAQFDDLSAAEQSAFSELLHQADQDIYGWIFNIRACPHSEWISVIEKIRALWGK